MKPTISDYKKPATVEDGHIFKSVNLRGEPLTSKHQGKRDLVFFECHLEHANIPTDAVVINCIGAKNRNHAATPFKQSIEAELKRQHWALIARAKKDKQDKKVKP